MSPILRLQTVSKIIAATPAAFSGSQTGAMDIKLGQLQ